MDSPVECHSRIPAEQMVMKEIINNAYDIFRYFVLLLLRASIQR
jgi:hypothetical protein